MIGKSRSWLAVLVAAMVVVALVGCQPTGDGGTEAADIGTLTPGVITVGADTAFPPFESMEGETPVGFDVDLGTAIGKQAGAEWKVVSTAWDGIIPGLGAGKYDVIMSAMTITDERTGQMDVTKPYILSDQSIATKKDSGIKEEADLKGKKVGVQVDTTGQFKAEEILGKTYKDLKKYDDILLAFQDLKAGRIDAIVNDLPVSAYVIKQNYADEMELVKTIKTDEGYGIWVKKGNTKLLDAIQKALDEVIASGEYATIYKKWFGQDPPAEFMPGGGSSTESSPTE